MLLSQEGVSLIPTTRETTLHQILIYIFMKIKRNKWSDGYYLIIISHWDQSLLRRMTNRSSVKIILSAERDLSSIIVREKCGTSPGKNLTHDV